MSSAPSQSLAPFLIRSWQPLLRGESIAAGHGEDLAAIFGGEVGRDEGAAGQVGLDHDRAEGHAGHDAVADGETLLVRRAVEGELGDQRPLAAMRSNSSAFSGGKTRLMPVPSTAMVRPLPLKRALVGRACQCRARRR